MAPKPFLTRLAFQLSPARAYRKTLLRAKRVKRELVEVFWELVYFLTHGCLLFFYDKTLPLTSRLFSRKPNPPLLGIKDVRANRIRLEIKSSFSSPFNVEQFEIEWAPIVSDQWTSTGVNDLQHRTVARLKGDTEYKFRARARSKLGLSGWSLEVQSRTKIDPKNGGGHAQGFTWEQTPTDVSIMFELPLGTKKSDVRLNLKPEWLRVELVQPDGTTKYLLEGDLYGKVKSFEHGSCWEIVKEGSKLMLNLTLEKATKSLAPKFDYWRAVIPGHHEIDTHKITAEETGTGLQMLQPGQYDPMQMRNMGVKGF